MNQLAVHILSIDIKHTLYAHDPLEEREGRKLTIHEFVLVSRREEMRREGGKMPTSILYIIIHTSPNTFCMINFQWLLSWLLHK